MIDREKLSTARESIQRELGEIAFRSQVLEKASEAVKWEEELVETLDRGGAGRSPFPYDSEGAWRLVSIEDEKVVYEPVIAKSELPADITPVRRIVNDEELANAQCMHCDESVPLIGRGSIVPFGFGDVADKYEVAVIHCNTVQLLLVPEDKLPFQAHIFPSDT